MFLHSREWRIKRNAREDACRRPGLHLTDYRGTRCAFPFQKEGRISFSRKRATEGEKYEHLPRSSFPRGWSSRLVASASNLAKLQRAISRRFADVTIRVPIVPFPDPSGFICTTIAGNTKEAKQNNNRNMIPSRGELNERRSQSDFS